MKNDVIITRLPTLCDPEKFNLKELREQYRLLADDAISQGHQLSDTCAMLHRTNQILEDHLITFNTLADSYDAGDQAAILLLVRRLSDRRKSYKKPEVH